jgi:uncharacterized protein involved in exopolysaccharide biosynthesis
MGEAIENSEFAELRRLVYRVWQQRSLLAVAIVLCSAGFAALAFLIPRVYRATVVLVPSGVEQMSIGGSVGSGALGGLAQLAGLSLGSVGNSTEEALAVLQSRQLGEQLLLENRMLPILFPEKWDKERQDWNVPMKDRPTLAIAFKYFDHKVRKISHDRRTGLVRLSIEWGDPNQAAEWANELVRRVNLEMRRRAMSNADAAVRHLESELALTGTIETRLAISRLLESQVNRRMIATVTEDYAFRVIESALPPDNRDFVRPRRALILIAGPLVGFALGVVGILIAASFPLSGQSKPKEAG